MLQNDKIWPFLTERWKMFIQDVDEVQIKSNIC